MKMSVQIGAKHGYPLWRREKDSTANKKAIGLQKSNGMKSNGQRM